MPAFDTDRGFPRESRIRQRREFQSVYREGERVETPFFTAYRRGGSTGCHRLGVTVTKKVGKAVVRNRVKRLFREVFRNGRPAGGPFWDVVLHARKHAVAAGVRDLAAEFQKVMGRAVRPVREE